ncbi:hypothetical protein K435DRAFT_829706 [Dendrothele bispora CBS 962.96]|uniref:Trafficking protein particle complex subunit 10 n=1 Tax=Dendrothele bispora (strain CBS 962.96) TaxID=1314807 RepID=A0A4S8LRU7_DENBC|nr:hypothetical protein K435DRAFT_829706 [Dendrothele bispora CBS 962.96]
MAKKSVLVSYAGLPSFLLSSNWDQFKQTLLAQLPLRNIHWKSASRTSIRTIQELDVSLVPLDSIRDELTSQVPTSILEKPLLNLYIVTCENADLEAYRTTIKKQVKEWHATVSNRKNQEWMILHVVRPDAKTPSGTFFQLKGSVLDKLKADFNTDKRDRCMQLIWTTNPSMWGEFITKLKDGMLVAFEAAVAQREEEVKRSESQRQMPGWNFCTFFILKESLASSFEGVTLSDEALLQYDELEASFYQALKEKNLSWFGTLISPTSKDDSSPLLSISKKPYRDLILANTITVFDFRIYLLTRQCELLAQSGRTTEVCKKTSAFLGAFGRRLREVEKDLPRFFLQSWIYSSALSVVEQCDSWTSGLSDVQLAVLNAGKGELLELARNQLDLIGMNLGFLPQKPPFSNVWVPISTETKSTAKISNPQLLKALDSQDAFYEVYINTTNHAIDLYAKAGRRKFALKLHGSLAALDLHRGQLDVALTTYNSLPAHYAPHMWTSLESSMLQRALETHAALGKPKDREWIHILLSFLSTYASSSGADMLMKEDEKIAYISGLIDALKVSASELESDLPHPDHPAISTQVSSSATLAETRDGMYLDATVYNSLPCSLPIDEISVILTGRDSERQRFSIAVESLNPGTSQIRMFSPVSNAGTFLLESSEIRMSRLLFHWTHRRTSTPKVSRAGRTSGVLVRIPRDLQAFDVQLRQPPRVQFGQSPSMIVAVSTGRNEVSKAILKLSTSSVTFDCQDTSLHTDGSAEVEFTPDSIILSNLPRNHVVELLVPHSDVSVFNAMKVPIEVEYVTTAEISMTRVLRLSRIISTALPISVNVEDFFRGKQLFSKFTVSTLSHQHVRIASAVLEPPRIDDNKVRVVTSCSQKRSTATVTPSQPANFLFQIKSDGPVRDPLTLNIKYRMLREEVEFVIDMAIDEVLDTHPEWHAHRTQLHAKLIEMLESDASWVEIYSISGELDVPGSIVAPGELHEPIEKTKKILQSHQHPRSPQGPWHEISIPVDVPSMTSTYLYAGQPISALLSIHTTFHWGSHADDKQRQYSIQYDVEEMVKEWLVSGKKRGSFSAMDDTTFTVPITLVALHHGEFTLPRVVVSALPLQNELTMGSMSIPSTETYQVHGAEKVLILPRGGRSTFVLGMGST